MKNYNQLYTCGDYENGILNIVIEIPLGSTQKIEWSRESKSMEINRIEPSLFLEPVNYGFVPQTTGGDDDNLDAYIISDISIPTSSVLEAKIIGIMKFIDDEDVDDKIVLSMVNDGINSISDLPTNLIMKIENYYNHYKDYIKPGITSVIGWGDVIDAKTAIRQSIERWQDQR